jgi:protein TonB
MKYQFRALQLSLALHALFFLIVIVGMSQSSVKTDNIITIDFSIEEPINSPVSLNINDSKIEPQSKIDKQKLQSVRKEVAKNITTGEEEINKTERDISANSKPTPIQETHLPVKAYTESVSIENIDGKPDKSNANIGKGSSSAGEVANSVVAKTSGGDSAISNAKQKLRYLKANFSYIKDIINKNIIYPRIARQMGWEGKVIVSFVIASDGMAKNIRVINSSGREIFDRNSVETIKNVSPFPKPPVEAQIIIPIQYRLR